MEKELIMQCDIALVYIRDSVFGELEAIRGPSIMPKTSTTPPQKPLASAEPPTLLMQEM